MKTGWLPLLFLFCYFVSPIDLFPDYLAPPGVGWLDDLFLVLAWWVLRRKTLPGRRFSSLLGAFFSKRGRKRFESGEERRKEAPAGVPLSREEARKILDVPGDADTRAVKEAYRRRCLEYHPDRVAHLGPELRHTAEREFKRIRAAYELLAASPRDKRSGGG
jgi:hypothetical protein